MHDLTPNHNWWAGFAIISFVMVALFVAIIKKTLGARIGATLLAFGLLGVAVMALDRITKIAMPGGGVLETATTQAVAAAGDIEAIKQTALVQSAAIADVLLRAQQAEEAAKSASSDIKDVAGKVAELNSDLRKSKALQAELKDEIDFAELVESAGIGDRSSFSRLYTITLDNNSPLNIRAKSAFNRIYQRYSASIELSSTIKPQFIENFGKLSFEELAKIVLSGDFNLSSAVLYYVVNQSKLDAFTKIDFLVDVADKGQILSTVTQAIRAFNDLTQNEFQVLDAISVSAWWAAHHNVYVDRPHH